MPAPAVQLPQAIATPTPTPPKAVPPKRPSLIGRASGDKATSQISTDTAKGSSPRRMSWMSKLSSNLSSSQQSPNGAKRSQATPANSHTPVASAKPSAGHVNGAAPGSPKEEAEPSPPPLHKSGKESFFSNALRRLSSNTSIGTGRTIPNGGLCPRRVMNIDHNRPRCLLPELDQSKLRKVAFCVDVEIAGGPRYKDDAEQGDKRKKKKDAKLKERGEGEALKHPQAAAEEKDASGKEGGEFMGTLDDSNPEDKIKGDDEKSSKKKEKKKRNEEERKERKEQRRRKAEENGTLPVQIRRDSDENGVPVPPSQIPRPMDRPTTDPLRIYRRCCQLRETPVLKRITEQLGNPTVCHIDSPGTVTCLDLTGSRLQFADVVTLSDWLAVVPVRKLILEDSDLTDEGIRVIMAGLLAAKTVDYFSRFKRKGDISNAGISEEKLGVVQKLSLKNNPKIGKEGWKHISLFIYMCSSLKALDVSMITFPPSVEAASGPDGNCRPSVSDPAEIFAKACSERLGGDTLEELIMAECSLTPSAIRKIVDGVTISGLKRLGVAGNRLDKEGMSHILRYIRSGCCQGIDLGSNDLRDHMADLADALRPESKLWALSLADCNLVPASLKPLFPAFLRLKDLRFLDLSHNHDLFSEHPSALGLLRKYLPQMTNLKRIHLMDVGMSPAQAIALAEVMPESPQLAHVNLLQNPQLSALASATDVATQEEACALYASLMMAARVSHSLISVDIDVPTSDNSEIVKALAKQVVAYCLRNMERFAAQLPENDSGPAQVVSLENGERGEPRIPEVLLHLIGNKNGQQEEHPEDPAPNEDYIVGGAGVVKALSYCLSEKASELRAASTPASGTVTPRTTSGVDIAASKAKEMSKDLLDSARKIRTKLHPAMLKEAKSGDDMAYRRLLFLDNTLQGMIQRFEQEYPDCRVTEEESPVMNSVADDAASSISSHSFTGPSSLGDSNLSSGTTLQGTDSDDEGGYIRISRRGSDISLASRAQAKEEGHVHRASQRVKSHILPAAGLEDAVTMSLTDPLREPEHLKILKAKLEAMSSDEWLELLRGQGWEYAAKSTIDKAEFLKNLEQTDPGELARIRDLLVKEGKMEPLSSAQLDSEAH
ncbi:hypothetical protein, variant [Verruconis gallopava]|nr:hypothetical protein, variant [Verruconis gallopava]KIW03641.1 hypothetical protein, variant [Verruconis gallopava]